MLAHQFTTIATADILDHLCAAVDAAREKMSASQAAGCWFIALDKAWDYLLTTDTIAFDIGAHAIRVPSVSKPGVYYHANGDCQCEAFTHGGACWHRSAARLVRRALELRAAASIELGRRIGAAQSVAMARPLRRCDDPAVSADTLVAELFA